MSESRILRLFTELGWNARTSTSILVALHLGLIVGITAVALLFQGYKTPAAPRFKEIGEKVRYQDTEVTPTDPAGMANISLGKRQKPLRVAWVGGSPLKIGPSRDEFENLAGLVAEELSSVANSRIDVTSVMLQASAFGDTYVAAKHMLDQNPDVLVMEANAVWFGNDLAISRYPYLSDELAFYLRNQPQLWPLALGSETPASAGIASVGTIFPPFRSVARTGSFPSAVAGGVDFIGLDVVRAQLSANVPEGTLAAYWQRGIQDTALFWQQVGINWRGRNATTLDGLQDESQVSFALLFALLESARAQGVPIYLYVNPIEFESQALGFNYLRFEAVRQKELILLGLESRQGSAWVTSPSKFLNGSFPEMTFRDENHVDDPGGMVELLAADLCDVFASVRPRSVECTPT